jgi:ABC-2 type transport system permease protein
MNPRMIFALVQKDITLYFKNRFFALITVLGLVAYIGIYFLLPRELDESLQLAWYAPELPTAFVDSLQEEGLVINAYPSETALVDAVEAGDEPFGIALPENFVPALLQGTKPQVRIYFQSELPDEFRDAYKLLMSELGFMLAGKTLNVEVEEVLLGQDMVGQQIAPRQRMLPVLVIFILMIEVMGLASLISSEIVTGTLKALLVTPLRVEGLFLSKTITGVLMAFSQVAILMGIIGGFQREVPLMLVTLLLAALLVTGLSFLVASVARDMMSVFAWGMTAIIILAIPAFNILLPGLTTDWIKVIPSYYMIDTIHRVVNFEAGWSQAGTNLLALSTFSVAFIGLGVVSLRRKLQ